MIAIETLYVLVDGPFFFIVDEDIVFIQTTICELYALHSLNADQDTKYLFYWIFVPLLDSMEF